MGLDEALLLDAGAPPTLRLYTWRPDTISLGWFQDLADVPAARRHADVVRRLTGGGAIHHDAGELTFSIATEDSDPLYRGPVAASYERVHDAIIAALRTAGVVDPRMRRDEGAASDATETGMCFHESTSQDIGWGAAGEWRKGVGTAQRRTKGRVLHHGSIKLAVSTSEPEIATLDDVGVRISYRDLAQHVVRAFASELGLELERTDVPHALLGRAEELGERYGDPAFLAQSRRKRTSRSKT